MNHLFRIYSKCLTIWLITACLSFIFIKRLIMQVNNFIENYSEYMDYRRHSLKLDKVCTIYDIERYNDVLNPSDKVELFFLLLKCKRLRNWCSFITAFSQIFCGRFSVGRVIINLVMNIFLFPKQRHLRMNWKRKPRQIIKSHLFFTILHIIQQCWLLESLR